MTRDEDMKILEASGFVSSLEGVPIAENIIESAKESTCPDENATTDLNESQANPNRTQNPVGPTNLAEADVYSADDLSDAEESSAEFSSDNQDDESSITFPAENKNIITDTSSTEIINTNKHTRKRGADALCESLADLGRFYKERSEIRKKRIRELMNIIADKNRQLKELEYNLEQLKYSNYN